GAARVAVPLGRRHAGSRLPDRPAGGPPGAAPRTGNDRNFAPQLEHSRRGATISQFTASSQKIRVCFNAKVWFRLRQHSGSSTGRRRFMRRVCVLTCALVALGATGASAQDFRGAIAGRISDISGGRLPGVTVTATNTATNVASTAATNTDGDFSIPFLNPGTYAVTAELSGFKKLVREGVEVRI